MKAFGCDLCRDLQEGETAMKLTITPMAAVNKQILYELCADCIQAFQGWVKARGAYLDEAPGGYE